MTPSFIKPVELTVDEAKILHDALHSCKFNDVDGHLKKTFDTMTVEKAKKVIKSLTDKA